MKPGPQSKYKAAYCALVIRLGKQGKSKAAMSNAIGISPTQMRKWCGEYSEFKEAVDAAVACAQEYWEERWDKEHKKSGFKQANQFRHFMAGRFRDEYGEHMTLAGDKDAPLVQHIQRTIVRSKERR